MRPVLSYLTRFFAWWFGELGSFLPQRWRASFRQRGQSLSIEISRDAATFRRYKGGSWHAFGQVPLRGTEALPEHQAVQHLLRKSRATVDDVGLCWSPELVLRRVITLPLLAAENLREVLAFEMDRYTPFKAEEVYFDYIRRMADKEVQQIAIELYVIPKSVADPFLVTLRSWGLGPDRMSVASTDGELVTGVNLLPEDTARSGSGLFRPVSIALALCACVLLVVAVYLPLNQQQKELAALEAQITQARSEFAQVEELKQRIGRIYERNRSLTDRKRSQPPMIAVLAELTRLLPDDTWIVELTLEGSSLALSGYSQSTSDLIRLLEQSDLFGDVRFSSPVMQDTRFERERFNISASIVTKGGSA